jgi:hypothetical protein
VFPAGGKLGSEAEVRFLGDAAGELVQTVRLPDTPQVDFGLLAEDAGGIAPSPNPFRLFAHGNAFEQEPNNALQEATAVELPLAFNGIIESEGDVDCFKFAAKKNQTFDVECYARRIRSPLDSVINLYTADGKRVEGNDDRERKRPDSRLRFKVPADGEYIIRVNDHLNRGGDDFVYRIEFHPVEPKLTLSIPRVERYGQYRQTIFVPRGNRFGTLINASRANFGGELVLEGGELPSGLTMHADSMPSNVSQMPVVFEAAADAPLSGQLVDFVARHAEPDKVDVRGHFTNHADFLVGPPGQSIYRTRDVDRLAVAVVDEVPFTLQIVQPNAPLVRDGSMQLKVVAKRKEGFTGKIRVEFPFRPPGVAAKSAVEIPEDKSEILYPLSANGNAALGTWRVFCLGSAEVGGRAWASSQLATLEVAEPFVKMEAQRASCEQGQDTRIACTLQHAAPFEGTAKAQLLGLPSRVTAEELEFTKDTEELVFDVQTDAASPAGKHSNIICQVTLLVNGDPVVNRAGTTELQIDKPLPPAADAPPAKAEPKKPVAQSQPANQPPQTKPLSRLEKLRLAAKQRKERQNEDRESP